MNKVLIAGVGTTSFGRFLGRGIRSLAVDAIDAALADAGAPANEVEKIFFGNAVAGVVTQQEMIRGQVALRYHALAGTPMINIENACASGGSSLHLAFEAVSAGQAEVVLAVGVEQMNHVDRARPFNALHGSTDVGEIGEYVPGVISSHSILMDFYAGVARNYLEKYDATAVDFARVAVKNRNHAVHNPIAFFRNPQTVDEVLNARMIIDPLTLPMCAPTTDGASALLICSEAYARRLSSTSLLMKACVISGSPSPGFSPVGRAAKKAYERSGVGIKDVDVIELHDAAAPAELLQYTEIGLCNEGEAHHLLRQGMTQLGGAIPVNPSGGLLSRGHALGATGCAQVAELCYQLRGAAGGRQVPDARLALAINGGGWLDSTYAVTVATILQRLDS